MQNIVSKDHNYSGVDAEFLWRKIQQVVLHLWWTVDSCSFLHEHVSQSQLEFPVCQGIDCVSCKVIRNLHLQQHRSIFSLFAHHAKISFVEFVYFSFFVLLELSSQHLKCKVTL